MHLLIRFIKHLKASLNCSNRANEEKFNVKKGFADGHYFSPVQTLDIIEEGYNSLDTKPSQIEGINLNDEKQLALLDELSKYYPEMPFSEYKNENFRYHLKNESFCHSDGISLYGMIRHFKPKNIIEIGSGNSSALMLDTNERFFDNNINFIFIEPYPKFLKSKLREEDFSSDKVKIIDKPLQDVDLELFKSLQENDILFIDSTHVSKAFSDVNKELFEILPLLNKGVIIHIHDIFYPFEYPKRWLTDEGRSWNEIYLIRAFLQYNSAFEVIFFPHFIRSLYPEVFQDKMPLACINTGGSLWLKKIQ